MKNKLLTFFILLLISFPNAYAFGPLYLDLHASAGYGKASAADESTSPSMIQYGAGTTIAYNMTFLFLGASADYFLVNQLTEPNTTFGNRGGKRTNLFSPTIGFRFPLIKIKLDYELNGTYTLNKTTSSGNTLKYKSPSGFRAYIGIPSPLFEMGVFYESIQFKTEVDGSTESTLTNKLKLQQIGLMGMISF